MRGAKSGRTGATIGAVRDVETTVADLDRAGRVPAEDSIVRAAEAGPKAPAVPRVDLAPEGDSAEKAPAVRPVRVSARTSAGLVATTAGRRANRCRGWT